MVKKVHCAGHTTALVIICCVSFLVGQLTELLPPVSISLLLAIARVLP